MALEDNLQSSSVKCLVKLKESLIPRAYCWLGIIKVFSLCTLSYFGFSSLELDKFKGREDL